MSDTVTIPLKLAGELGIFGKLRELGYVAEKPMSLAEKVAREWYECRCLLCRDGKAECCLVARIQSALDEVRLEEAGWWRYLVIMDEDSYFAVEGDKRIRALAERKEPRP